MKNRNNSKSGYVVIIAIVLLITAYYFYTADKSSREKEAEAADEVTAVQEVLLKDLKNNYPPSPKEVLRYYGELSRCLYGETYTEEEFKLLAEKIRELYDDELLKSNENEAYLNNLKLTVDEWNEKKRTIMGVVVSASTDVEYFSEDGFDFARLRCLFNIRQDTAVSSSAQIFLLRKDKDEHWKIYAWKVAPAEIER